VTRLGTPVVVSRVSGGENRITESDCIASRRDLESKIPGGFREGLSVIASAQSSPVIVFRLSVVWRFSGTACGIVRLRVEIIV
jgi:hypothetical protein